MKEYQQRVVEEKEQLDSKLDKLAEFIKNDTFDALALDEQDRLRRQHLFMLRYSGVLEERISHFQPESTLPI